MNEPIRTGDMLAHKDDMERDSVWEIGVVMDCNSSTATVHWFNSQHNNINLITYGIRSWIYRARNNWTKAQNRAIKNK